MFPSGLVRAPYVKALERQAAGRAVKAPLILGKAPTPVGSWQHCCMSSVLYGVRACTYRRSTRPREQTRNPDLLILRRAIVSLVRGVGKSPLAQTTTSTYTSTIFPNSDPGGMPCSRRRLIVAVSHNYWESGGPDSKRLDRKHAARHGALEQHLGPYLVSPTVAPNALTDARARVT